MGGDGDRDRDRDRPKKYATGSGAQLFLMSSKRGLKKNWLN